MVQDLIKLADYFDYNSKFKEANLIDSFIKKFSQNESYFLPETVDLIKEIWDDKFYEDFDLLLKYLSDYELQNYMPRAKDLIKDQLCDYYHGEYISEESNPSIFFKKFYEVADDLPNDQLDSFINLKATMIANNLDVAISNIDFNELIEPLFIAFENHIASAKRLIEMYPGNGSKTFMDVMVDKYKALFNDEFFSQKYLEWKAGDSEADWRPERTLPEDYYTF